MIAAIERDHMLHIVRWTGRVRLHVEIQTYCGLKCDAGTEGVLQVSEMVFTGRRNDVIPGPKRTPCPQCHAAAIG